MATNKSEHLQLHLWEPEDSVLRTEFNENWEKIDGAAERLQTELSEGLAGCGNCRMTYGSYTGTGKSGADAPNSLTFDFTPKIVIVYPPATSYAPAIMVAGGEMAQFDNNYCTVSWSGKRVSWYSTNNAYYQLNGSGAAYQYVALGS